MPDAPEVIVAGQPFVLVVQPAAPPAIVIAAGNQGPAGRNGAAGGATFEWHQQIALAVWTVPHNLSRRPSVTVTDEAGSVVEPDVRYVDGDIVQITHGQPLTGWAYCN